MNDLYRQAKGNTMVPATPDGEKWTQLTERNPAGTAFSIAPPRAARPSSSAAYSLGLMPASAITLAHLAMSVLMVVPSAAGVLPTVSTPI